MQQTEGRERHMRNLTHPKILNGLQSINMYKLLYHENKKHQNLRSHLLKLFNKVIYYESFHFISVFFVNLIKDILLVKIVFFKEVVVFILIAYPLLIQNYPS